MGQTLKQGKKKGKQVLMNQITCFFHIIRYLFVFKTFCMTDTQEDIAYHRLTLHHYDCFKIIQVKCPWLSDRDVASHVRGPGFDPLDRRCFFAPK